MPIMLSRGETFSCGSYDSLLERLWSYMHVVHYLPTSVIIEYHTTDKGDKTSQSRNNEISNPGPWPKDTIIIRWWGNEQQPAWGHKWLINPLASYLSCYAIFRMTREFSFLCLIITYWTERALCYQGRSTESVCPFPTSRPFSGGTTVKQKRIHRPEF
jgi:hypothetical protein